MEPKVDKGTSDDSPPSTPPPEYFETAATSPVSQEKRGLDAKISNETEISIPYTDGVKFVDSSGNVYTVNKDDSICSSDESDEDKEDPRHEVPDGGWGWVIVAASLVISMVADGISYSFGLIYIQFLNNFEASAAKTSWIGSLFLGVPLLSGPIMSAFVDRYGCKWMTIAGGIIAGFGFLLSCFGNSVEYEYITFGVIAGLGLGLCYVTAVVAVCQWFEKRRALATGLGACGTGFGTFIYAPLTNYLIDEFGWRGAVLILGGTFLQMCICGALMRDPLYLQERKMAEKIGKTASSIGSVSGLSQFPGSGEIRNMMKSGKKPEEILSQLTETFRTTDEVINTEPEEPKCHSVVDLPTHIQTLVPLENILEEQSVIPCITTSDQKTINHTPERNRILSIRRMRKNTMPELLTRDDPNAPDLLLASANGNPVITSEINKPKRRTSRIFSQKCMFIDPPQPALQGLRVHRNSMMFRAATLTTGRYHLRASSCPNIFRNSMTTLAKEEDQKWYSELKEFGKTVFDFSMFLELHFLLVSIGVILLFTFFIVPYFYLVEMMTRYGYTAEEGSRMIRNIGIINAFGMIFFGWVGDMPKVDIAQLFAGCMICCGISCTVLPLLVTDWWGLTAAVSMFGFFFASSYSLTPPIIVELIPVERFSTAYGLILLCQGIGNLIGPPIAGGIFDYLGRWDMAFYVAGAGIILCGFFIGSVSYTKNRRIWGTGLLEMDRISNA